jgi:hypothetical protein
MNTGKGDRSFGPQEARTKGCLKPFNWSIINVLYNYSNLSMQGRFKMEYRLLVLTIVRYNYRDLVRCLDNTLGYMII